MPGFEIFGDEERKEVQDVLETGIFHRYGFDGPRKGHWKAKSFEEAFCEKTGAKYGVDRIGVFRTYFQPDNIKHRPDLVKVTAFCIGQHHRMPGIVNPLAG